jgi:hypothetical protein
MVWIGFGEQEVSGGSASDLIVRGDVGNRRESIDDGLDMAAIAG